MLDFHRIRDAANVLRGKAAVVADEKPKAPLAPSSVDAQANAALVLRLGLGFLFVIGGLAKLSRLLSPSAADGIVAQYMGPLGYINETFQQWLFAGWMGDVMSPWLFLTLLSSFELVSGLMLMAGLFVRGLAAFWALLLWSFVFSLPVVTTPGVAVETPTYTSPALFVQIRDVALSGLFIVLYNLGPGARSIDADRLGAPAALGRGWDPLGLVLRLSLALVFLVGGFFHGYAKIVTFDAAGILLVIVGLGLAAGVWVRSFAIGALIILAWYMIGKLGAAGDLLGYLNAVKREFAFVAAGAALAVMGGGAHFTLPSIYEASRRMGGRVRAAFTTQSRPAIPSQAAPAPTEKVAAE